MYARLSDAFSDAASILGATYRPRNRYEVILNILLALSSFGAMQPVLKHNVNSSVTAVCVASSIAIVLFLSTIALFTAVLIVSILSYNLISGPEEAIDLRILNSLRRSWFVVLTFIIIGAVSASFPH